MLLFSLLFGFALVLFTLIYFLRGGVGIWQFLLRATGN